MWACDPARVNLLRGKPMHDHTGKLMNVGDEVYSYRFGLCKVLSIADTSEGSFMRVKVSNGEEVSLQATDYYAKVRSWKELAQEVLDCQDACNLSGIVKSFANVVAEVRARLESENKGGTDNVNEHPVCQLWADKIAHLTNTQTYGNEQVRRAYDWAYDKTNRNKGLVT